MEVVLRGQQIELNHVVFDLEYRNSTNSFLPSIVSPFNSFRGNYSIYEVDNCHNNYENFHIFHFQKSTVFAKSIRGSTVKQVFLF